ncbi:hypothetical protein CCZ01_06130 [Helicobacter monodelphidis]|uniref:hypothetical protein n=1 Tax=Helicobacter sp. 15-1451 TaxID=2004995 RepID=UPI000DCD41BE|nr:hypothetical protein [Helicobacter sp. 15-1451]RAX57413.1 hypothetical protein CCZ01_06130 [Helicobacter sp. 15-1451]
MDNQQYLIIIKGEDKTSEIISYAFQGEKVEITYPNKTYLYAKNNVEIFTNPLDLGDKISLKQGDLLCVQQALKFDTYIKIFFDNGTEEIIPSSALQASSDSHAKPHIILFLSSLTL